ncbi:MAG: hypothetical protein ACC661_09245, partial [Verrucomicrobiales bacterium]
AMDTLGKPVVYMGAIAWAGTELLILAGKGTELPLILGFLGFVVAFAMLGCLPLPDATVNRVGALFLGLTAIVCLLFALSGFSFSFLALLKLAAALVICVVALLDWKASQAESAGQH